MAKVKFGLGVSEIRGKEGGSVWSRNTAGAYIRNFVVPINPKTVAQSLVRTLFATIMQAWRGLTEVQRKTWNTVAATLTFPNVFGDNVAPTGFGLHAKLNRNLQEIGEAIITTPPTAGAVDGLTSLTAVIDNAEIADDDKIKLTFAPVIPADQKTILYATPALSAGVSFVDSEYRKIKIMDTADLSPFPVGAAYITVFGAIPAVGQKAFFKMRPVVIASGQSGTDLAASDVAV